jgi:hypothetical protein
MNCNEFETLVNDLARKRMMDAALRQTCDSHAKDCPRCHARLAEEKQLTVGLRALAILDENKQASAAVEANLLGAFRKQGSAPQAAVSANLTSAIPVVRRSPGRPWWLAAAAAVILLLSAIAIVRLQNPESPAPAPPQRAERTPETPEPAPHTPDKVLPDTQPSPVIGNNHKPKQAPKPPRSRNASQRLSPLIATNSANGDPSTTAEPVTQSEITTPFISLTQGYSLAMPEGGQVVRVELPRATLASFGLPVNAQRINEPVKADVVVGNDGIARAIRFVR